VGKMQLLVEKLSDSARRELEELGNSGVGSLEWLVSWAAATIHVSANQLFDVVAVTYANWLAAGDPPIPGYCPEPATPKPALDAMEAAFGRLHEQQQQADGFNWPAGPKGASVDRTTRPAEAMLHGHVTSWVLVGSMRQGAERVYTLGESKGAASRIGLSQEAKMCH
jgi:hypothetical protein